MYISELDPADPRARTAIPAADAMTKAQAALNDLTARLDRLEAAPVATPAYIITKGARS